MPCDPMVLDRELYYTERTQLQYNSPSKIGAPRQYETYSMLGNILFCLTLFLRVGKNIILNGILTTVALTKLTLKLTLVTLQATSDILDSISESCGFLRSILGTIFDTLLTIQEVIETHIRTNINQFAKELHW